MIEYRGDAPAEVGALIRKYARKKKRPIPTNWGYSHVLRKFDSKWVDFHALAKGIVVSLSNGEEIKAKNPTDLKRKLEALAW